MQLKEFVQAARSRLSEIYPSEEANTITGVLCTEFLGVESYTYMVNPTLELKPKQLALAEPALERLLTGEPLQYVLGYTLFYDQRFNVSSSVLIPRPETEWICRQVIEQGMMLYRHRSAYGVDASPVRILDLCTGSGCIAWTMAANIPGCEVVGIDVSADAIHVAETQSIVVEKGHVPRFFQADIFDSDAMALALQDETPFDIVISNPPYVMESEKYQMRDNVLMFEPAIALFVPDSDPLRFYRKIADICTERLSTEGVGFVEINEQLGLETSEIFQMVGFKKTEVSKDLCGKPRMIRFSR